MGTLVSHSTVLPALSNNREPPVAQALTTLGHDLKHTTLWGWLWIALLTALIVIAASLIQISGAIVVQGQVRAGGEPVPIRPEMGGRLVAILAQAGDRVGAGQPLLQLDRRDATARLADLGTRHDHLLARTGRLQALIDGGSIEDHLGPEWAGIAPTAIADEARVLLAERALDTQDSSLAASRIAGTQAQIIQLDAQLAAQRRQLAVTRDELVGLRSLLERGLTAQARVRGLERLVESQLAEIASSESERAALTARLDEIARELAARRAARQAAWFQELQSARSQLDETNADRSQTELAASRTTLKAPISGIIVNAIVRAPGTVIAAGETLMAIVATDTAPLIQATIQGRDIEKITQGQAVQIDLSPLDAMTTNTIEGTITRIAADANRDQAGQLGYPIEITLSPNSTSLPTGAPVRVLLPTAEESLMGRLLSPLQRRIGAALQEG